MRTDGIATGALLIDIDHLQESGHRKMGREAGGSAPSNGEPHDAAMCIRSTDIVRALGGRFDSGYPGSCQSIGNLTGLGGTDPGADLRLAA
jgi:hypothetical protein